MKATSQIQANRIAFYGSQKMESYTMALTSVYNKVRVYKADGTMYRVCVGTPTGAGRKCECPFFKENKEFTICKHIVWAEAELDRIAQMESLIKQAGKQ